MRGLHLHVGPRPAQDELKFSAGGCAVCKVERVGRFEVRSISFEGVLGILKTDRQTDDRGAVCVIQWARGESMHVYGTLGVCDGDGDCGVLCVRVAILIF